MSEEKKDKVEELETRELITYVSGEYLSAASQMIAWQFIDGPDNYGGTDRKAERRRFTEEAAHLMRHNAPQAYQYFFENNHTDHALPPGTIDIILSYVWKERPLFMGGEPIVKGIIH